jgi:voltage-gated potassium channel
MTTVGYGDVYPQTPLGKLLGSIVAFLGVGLFALPTGILGAGFLEEAGRKRLTAQRERMCPHCGGRLEP